LVDLADGLRAEESGDFWPASSFLPVDVEVFSLGLVVLVGLLLVLEGIPFLVNLTLREDARFYIDFLLGLRVQVHLYRIVPLTLFLALFFAVEAVGVVELLLDLGVEFDWRFELLGTEDPLGHF
jgi:hypothetical protein